MSASEITRVSRIFARPNPTEGQWFYAQLVMRDEAELV